MLAFGCTQFILLIFFCPETQYRRPKIFNIDTSVDTDFGQLEKIEAQATHGDNTESPDFQPPPSRKTFFQRMAVYTGSYSNNNVLTMLLSTILIVTNLGALWVIIVTGLLVAWVIATSFAFPPLLYAPPYLFNAAQVGYVSTGPLIGSLLGLFICGATLDRSLKWLARKNSGV